MLIVSAAETSELHKISAASGSHEVNENPNTNSTGLWLSSEHKAKY